jgi:hypothetical protein
MYQIIVYVPEDYCQSVKAAMFAAGAGKLGAYDSCAWQVLGEGQFRPLKGSKPFIGHESQTEKVREFKVEMLCSEQCLPATLKALKDSHPYETPAFSFYPVNQTP